MAPVESKSAEEHVYCPYCGGRAATLTGQDIYPHRGDLYGKKFYACRPCGAWVGCHPDGSPMGRLADQHLRRAKMAVHAVFDPIWEARYARKHAEDPAYSKQMARGGRYKRLAQLMGLAMKGCHIGMFDVDQCHRAIQIIKSGALEREELTA